MYTNPSDSLNLLNPNATATISLQGLMLFCFDRKRRCQIGILRCDDHDLQIDIMKIPKKPASKNSNACELISPKMPLDQELYYVNVSDREGIKSHKNFKIPFNRLKQSTTKDEARDFRWIINLESEEFHNRKLEIISNGTEHDQYLWPKIIIDAGIVYTQAISSEILTRRDEEGRYKMLGRIAYKIGIDIMGDTVCIRNKDKKDVYDPMTKSSQYLYLIQITNLCPQQVNSKEPELNAGKSDFDQFYKAVKDPIITHRKFDLQGCIDPDNIDNPGYDGFPDICIGGYLGDTDDLGRGY